MQYNGDGLSIGYGGCDVSMGMGDALYDPLCRPYQRGVSRHG
jgi:hypothetical protein